MVCSIFCFGKIGLLVNDNSKMKTQDKNILFKYSKNIPKYSKIFKYKNLHVHVYIYLANSST
jgi:hypothetical protein